VQKNSKSVDDTSQLTVYYDGSCPLCSKEINWYQKHSVSKSIEWHDVSQSSEERVATDLATAEALRRFHVRKHDGSVVSGAAAFSELWLCVPKFKPIGTLLKVPIFSHVAELVYRLFLKVRPLMQRFLT